MSSLKVFVLIFSFIVSALPISYKSNTMSLNIYCNITEYPYSNGCPANSECISRQYLIPYCQCKSGYVTYNNTFCDYKQACAITPLILDICLQWLFPVGQVYISECNINVLSGILAIVQIFTSGISGLIVVFIIGCIISCVQDEQHTTITFPYHVLLIFTTISWWVVNIVNDARTITTDTNGVPISFSSC